MNLSGTFDVVIVGAGAAGIGAGLAAQAAGLNFVIVEAMERIGGRAFTDHASLGGIAWDHGCHWLHSASRNPLRAHADAMGVAYHAANSTLRLSQHGQWLGEAEAAALHAAYDGFISEVVRTGETLDRAMATFLPTDSPYLGAMIAWVAQAYARHPATLSAQDIARYELNDTHENWPVRDGYGTIFARLAAGLPITLSAPVQRIDWGGDEIEIHTPQGTLRSRTVIVTASTSVLAAEVIDFDPVLPEWKQAAFASAPLGANAKVAVRFADPAILADVPPCTFSPDMSGDGTGFWLRPFDQPVAIAILGGPRSAEIETLGAAAAVEYTREKLQALFGPSALAQISHIGYVSWLTQPYIRGSYSASLPTQAHLRQAIAQPIANRLFFAGEATSLSDFSTAHGAYDSGFTAINGVLAALGRMR